MISSRMLAAGWLAGCLCLWAPPTYANASTVIFVHGYDLFLSQPPSGRCREGFGDLATALSNDSNPALPHNLVFLGYYAGDVVGPDACTDTFASANRDTSIAELGKQLAQYLVAHYSGANRQPIDIVAHSMGGLIVRSAIVQSGLIIDAYGREVVDIEDVVTGGSPHDGALGGTTHILRDGSPVWNAQDACNLQALASFTFKNTWQCLELLKRDPAPTLIDRMNQVLLPGTADWTLIGSSNDEFVSAASATHPYAQHYRYANQASHFEYFTGPASTWGIYYTLYALASDQN